MPLLHAGRADRDAEHEASVHLGVAEERAARGVDACQERLVGAVFAVQAEADEGPRRGVDELEARVRGQPVAQPRGEGHVPAHERLQPVHAEVPDHEPELECTEAAAEGHLPVAVVDHLAGVGGGVAQVFGQHAQRLHQRGAVADPEGVAVEVDEHPLVRVHAVAVGLLHAGVDCAEFRAERGDSQVRGVHVEPGAVRGAGLGDLRHGVHGVRGGGAHGGHAEEGAMARCGIGRHHGAERGRVHGAVGAHRHHAQVGGAEAGDADVLLDAAVRLRAGVGNEARAVRLQAVARSGEAGGALARGDERAERGAACRVLDDAAAGGGAEKVRGKSKHARQPVHDVRLQLRARGRRAPQHALHAEARAQELAEDARAARVGGEVREEVRALPVRDARQHDAIHVRHHGIPRFTFRGRGGGQLRAHPARLHGGLHRVALDAVQVVGDPLHHGVAVLPEIEGLWRCHGRFCVVDVARGLVGVVSHGSALSRGAGFGQTVASRSQTHD